MRGLRGARVLLLAAVIGSALGACKAKGEGAVQPLLTGDVSAEDYPMPPLPKARVYVEDAFGGHVAVEVEVAADDAARTRGLMWRRKLPEGTGMLFVFPRSSPHSFWMRNTLIPLDMLFIAADGRVVGIVENAEPRTLTSRSVPGVSKYVLEVPGGWSEKEGLRPGALVRFEGLGAVEVQ